MLHDPCVSSFADLESHDDKALRVECRLMGQDQELAAGPAGQLRKGDQALRRARERLTTKTHLAVDMLGRALKFLIAPGQHGEAPIAPALREGLVPSCVLADKGYHSNALRTAIASMGAEAVIPCNPT